MHILWYNRQSCVARASALLKYIPRKCCATSSDREENQLSVKSIQLLFNTEECYRCVIFVLGVRDLTCADNVPISNRLVATDHGIIITSPGYPYMYKRYVSLKYRPSLKSCRYRTHPLPDPFDYNGK